MFYSKETYARIYVNRVAKLRQSGDGNQKLIRKNERVLKKYV